MASKYLRHSTWWVQFYHPHTRALIRESLGTPHECHAEILRERIDHEIALLDPRFQAVSLPPKVSELVGAVRPTPTPQPAALAVVEPTDHPMAPPRLPTPAAGRVDDALKSYVEFICTDNADLHVANKLSILRRFFGSQRLEKIFGPGQGAPSGKTLAKPAVAFFTGELVAEISPTLVQRFIEQLPLATKTKRHYREVFHHFFEFCIKFWLYQPTNWHCPNPVAALPSYVVRNRHITFLTKEQIDTQIITLADDSAVQMAVAIMLHAGLRRAETLWLTRDSLAADLSYLSVLNRRDEDDIGSSLKTGERAVTILPPLRAALEKYLPSLKGKWLIPDASGKRWRGDTFGRRLRKLNDDHQLSWTCLAYRHTYATQRAAEGWTLFRISKELGNSVAVVEEYYAGYIRPEGSVEA